MIQPPGTLVIALLSLSAINGAVADTWNHEVRSLLAKRQDLSSCSSTTEDACNIGPEECMEAMCAACSGYKQIAECCAIESLYMSQQCFLNSIQNPSYETVASSSATQGLVMSITSNASMPTSIPVSAGLQACSQVDSIVKSCKNQHLMNANMSLSNNDFHCVCYASGRYDADRYNEPYSTCMSYLSMNDRDAYARFTASNSTGVNLSPCSQYVNGSANSTTSTTTWSSRSTWYIGYTVQAGQSPIQASSDPQANQASSNSPTPAATMSSSASSLVDTRFSVVLISTISSLLFVL